MPWGLKRYYGTGSLHFITWSCYRRKPLLGNPARRDLLLTVLELMRVRYRFAVIGYAVMPEHVHLFIAFIAFRSMMKPVVRFVLTRESVRSVALAETPAAKEPLNKFRHCRPGERSGWLRALRNAAE